MGDPDTPTDPRMQSLEYQLKEAEIRKTAAEARQAETAGLFPELPSELPSESLDTGDQGSPLGSLAAYKALQPIAESIAKVVKKHDLNRVWLLPDERIARYKALHDLVTSNLERLEKMTQDAKDMISPAPATQSFAVAAGLTFAASAISTVFALTKRDTTIRQRAVTISYRTISALIASELKKEGITALLPGPAFLPTAGALAKRVDSLTRERDSLAQNLAEYRARNGSDSAVTTYVEDVIKMLDGFLVQLRTSDDEGLNPLLIANTYEENKQSAVLIVDPSFAAGESVYESIPIKRDRGLHTGSAVVTYLLFRSNGELLSSGIFDGYKTATNTIGKTQVEWK